MRLYILIFFLPWMRIKPRTFSPESSALSTHLDKHIELLILSGSKVELLFIFDDFEQTYMSIYLDISLFLSKYKFNILKQI